jgi:hypothetical protein
MAGTNTRLAALAIAGGCAMLLPAAPALTCGRTPHFAYIHSALPNPLPRGTIVALVDFLPRRSARNPGFASGDRVRIRRMIQGTYRGKHLISRPAWSNSCEAPFANGRSGYIVAVARGLEHGVLVVDPISVGMDEGHRLPDGWQLPREFKPVPLTDEHGDK